MTFREQLERALAADAADMTDPRRGRRTGRLGVADTLRDELLRLIPKCPPELPGWNEAAPDEGRTAVLKAFAA